MKKLTMLFVFGSLAVAGCGGDDSGDAASTQSSMPASAPAPAAPKPAKPKPTGTRIAVGDSDYGTMLFNADKQAIYVFQNDSRNKSVCEGECAAAWPPVYTKGEPQAITGARQALLGTIERSNGRLQVTYAGRPLYYYAHEGPGEVRCHNVNLNGGLWWVVAPNGRHRT